MTPEFASFGDPQRFEIALRWRSDMEQRSRRPAEYGWSIGDLRLTVAGQPLTANERGAARQSFVSWYLFPLFLWFGENWGRLLHEEDFAWAERSAAPAVSAVSRRMHKLIDAVDPQGQKDYLEAQEWRQAHALDSAANGGLLPDVHFRRYLDFVEVSWTSGAPLFGPNDFRFTSEPGVAYLPVRDVATPLWDALQWVRETGAAQASSEQDLTAFEMLGQHLSRLESQTVIDFASYLIGRRAAEAAKRSLEELGAGGLFSQERVPAVPAVERFSPAIAMYGGLAPNLTDEDVATLSEVAVAASRASGKRKKKGIDALQRLVPMESGPPVRPPHLEGGELAALLLEEESVAPFLADQVDIKSLLEHLGVQVLERELHTETVRGVSLAGDGLAPTIVVNTNSIYNETAHGVRFTLAHELAHLLYDRSMAVSVGIASGPWAPAGVEKRANAFAASFLMPRWLVLRAFGSKPDLSNIEAISAAADRLKVSATALVEHLANLDLISIYDRDLLRSKLKQSTV